MAMLLAGRYSESLLMRRYRPIHTMVTRPPSYEEGPKALGKVKDGRINILTGKHPHSAWP